ncbi:DUF4168 domain-containing protein [Candidimonas sp. SYP-B2681]|uniref:DUF4168 domain-containing protein n=1 Tax=Candidimonas sp. SYP-B2681 TaxID=2497686 RepID=UPI000F875BC6|nr:DUF4168 domain-containing protein [Candidimonas sp. SYP-B2681]RTZ42565.1 DUF4168 domain-containing protein [Candidimonas sp. SYP-B2681]
MQKWITTTLSASLIAIGLSSGAAMAQQSATGAGKAAITAAAPNFTDAQLQKFVAASQKVAVISEEFRPKVMASNDESARNKVLEQADEKMVRAVHDEGMTVDQFNGMNQALQQNPELVQRVQKMVK